jgi:serine protein kinase
MVNVDSIAKLQDMEEYRNLNWEGGFDDYLELVKKRPLIVRSSYQRMYDMILSYGARGVRRQPQEAHPLPVLPDEQNGGATPSSASTSR